MKAWPGSWRRLSRARVRPAAKVWRRRLVLLLPLALWLVGVRPAAAVQTRLHAIVVGNNANFAPADPGTARLEPLAHADDDAAAFAELVGEATASVHLLSVFDADTQALYPRLVPVARPPTLPALRGAVRSTAERIAREPNARHAVIFFFSGHGVLDYRGEPALLLADRGLTRSTLYEEVLRPLANYPVHLLVDACHAEAVVRPRGAGGRVGARAELVPLSARHVQSFLAKATLGQFPNVGALIASSLNAEAHELSALGQGVFTHQLLSGLRGGADVNGDHRLEYSEMYAFLSAANRGVATRHRLQVVARPPPADLRRPLFDTEDIPDRRVIQLRGLPSEQLVVIKDDRGRSVVTLNADSSYSPELVLPAGAPLYLRVGEWETSLPTSPGTRVDLADLAPEQSRLRARRGSADGYRERLFESPFGRLYYEAVVAHAGDLLPVEFDRPVATRPAREEEAAAAPEVALAFGGGVARGLLEAAPAAVGWSVGLRPTALASLVTHLSYARADRSGLLEQQVDASLGWQWPLVRGPASVWAGPCATVGVAFQRRESSFVGETLRGGAGLAVALTTPLSRHIHLWAESRSIVSTQRVEARTSLRFEPSGWVGITLPVGPSW